MTRKNNTRKVRRTNSKQNIMEKSMETMLGITTIGVTAGLGATILSSIPKIK